MTVQASRFTGLLWRESSRPPAFKRPRQIVLAKPSRLATGGSEATERFFRLFFSIPT